MNESGCPAEEKDSDADGIPDSRDVCADTPTDAVVTSDGCPVDVDGDGIADYIDACPGSPKGVTTNERGCWTLKGLKFAPNKSNITPERFDVLGNLVKVLRDNSDIRLEIQGYTDSQGNSEMNRKLSDKRANEIRDYLIKYHIDESRLDANGYGEEKPVDSNETAEGRAKNRRVELNPLK